MNSFSSPDNYFALLQTMYDHMPVGLELYDKEGKLIEVNRKDMELLGIGKKEDILGFNLFDDPNIPEAVKERLRAGENAGFSARYDFTKVKNRYYKTCFSGSKYLEIQISIVKDAQGKPDKYLSIVQDITDKMEDRTEITQTLLKYENLFNSVEAGVEYYDRDGKLLEVNQYMVDLLGVRDKETLFTLSAGLFSRQYLSQEAAAAVRQGRHAVVCYDFDFDRQKRENGFPTRHTGIISLEIRINPLMGADGSHQGTIVMLIDITADAGLRKKYENLYNQNRTILESLPVGVEVYSGDGKLLYLNNRNCQIFGVTAREALSGKINIKDNPNLPPEVKAAVGINARIHVDFDYDFSKVARTGYYESSRKNEMKRIDCWGTPVINSEGKAENYVFIMNDITDYYNQSRLLEESRNNLVFAMEAGNISAWVYDISTGVTRMLYGDKVGENREEFYQALHPDDRKKFQLHFEGVFSGEKSKDTIRFRVRRQNEAYRYFESTISLVSRDGGVGGVGYLIGTFRDITGTISIEMELKKQKEFVTLALSAGEMAVWIYDIKDELFYSLQGNALAGDGLSMAQNMELLHPEDAAGFPDKFRQIISGEVSRLHLKLRYRDPLIEGGYRHYESSIIPFYNESGRITHLTGTQKEVTNEFFQQAELRQSKKKTELAIQTANMVLWEYDTRTHLFTCYNEPLNDFDNSRKLTREDYRRSAHDQDRELLSSKVDFMDRGEDKPFTFEVRMKYGRDSQWQYCTVSGSPFEKNEAGKVVRYVGFRKDNTDLQKRRALLSNILDNVPIPIHIKDVEDDYRYVFWNEESKNLFGDGYMRSASSLVDERRAQELNEVDRQVYETEMPYLGQEKIVLLDGREYETIVRKSVIYDDDKKYVLVVRWNEGIQNELERKSKILSISVEALNAYTWYYDSREGELIFGDGFEKTGGDRKALSSFKKFARQIHPEDRERFLRFMEEFMEQEKGEFSIEYKIDFSGNGEYEWWECRGAMEKMEKNGSSYKYVYGMDINIEAHKRSELALLENRKEMAQLIRQNELVLNNTNSGLAFITPDYIVQWENISVCSSSVSFEAYKKGEFCYKSAHNRTAPCVNCVMQRALQSGQMEQIMFDFNNGNTIEVFATPVMGKEGKVEGVVIRVDDVTERKRMITALEKAKMQAEQSDKLKSAFLANMSHEIRTPLNAIVGFSNLMLTTEDEQEKEEYSKIINTNNELLLKLINDILDLSKIEAGFVEMKSQQFDLAEYFNEIGVSMERRITGRDIAFICKNPYRKCIVELDKSRLTQILTNYVTNAIKYTQRGFIEMGYEYAEGGIRLYARDSGIGISGEKKQKVFRRFEKLDEFAQGTGLGLSICKAIVEAFGGKVGFDSTEGKGSLFWAFIPCTAEIEKKESRGISGGEKSILIVEDIQSNYLLLKALLKNNYVLLYAVNGLEALKIIKTRKVDLVLMDMKMPLMNGLEATKEIRKFNPEVPVIALTAHAFEADKETALQAGCSDYLLKPVNKEKLFSVLNKYLAAEEKM